MFVQDVLHAVVCCLVDSESLACFWRCIVSQLPAALLILLVTVACSALPASAL